MGIEVKLIYIGPHFYMESGTIMSPVYSENGERSDWGLIQLSLKRGDSISIRQATNVEKDFYEARLARLKETLKGK